MTLDPPTAARNVAASVLAAARVALRDRAVARIPTAVLLGILSEHPEPRWPRPLSDRMLARLLRRAGVRPLDLRFGSRIAKGYRLADLELAAARLADARSEGDTAPRSDVAGKTAAPPRTLDALLDQARGLGLAEPALTALRIILSSLTNWIAMPDWGEEPADPDTARAQALNLLAQPDALRLVGNHAINRTPEALAQVVVNHLIKQLESQNTDA